MRLSGLTILSHRLTGPEIPRGKAPLGMTHLQSFINYPNYDNDYH
jgi:hypothetical protein